ncbi:MAG: hypothetical protein IPJ71_18415 [Bdellovibrionales bacterium]|nr:hypothetical protein [Bdellovibrionales bacterium]
MGSINTLGNCLRKVGIDEAIVKEIQDSLKELWDMRSQKGVAHLGNRPTGKHLKDVFSELVEKVAAAYTLLCEILAEKYTIELP